MQHLNVQVANAFHVKMEIRAAILVKHVKGEVANVELPLVPSPVLVKCLGRIVMLRIPNVSVPLILLHVVVQPMNASWACARAEVTWPARSTVKPASQDHASATLSQAVTARQLDHSAIKKTVDANALPTSMLVLEHQTNVLMVSASVALRILVV